MSPGSSMRQQLLELGSTTAAGTISQMARGSRRLRRPARRAMRRPIAPSFCSAATAAGCMSWTTHSWPFADQPPHHAGAHPAEADHRELHDLFSVPGGRPGAAIGLSRRARLHLKELSRAVRAGGQAGARDAGWSSWARSRSTAPRSRPMRQPPQGDELRAHAARPRPSSRRRSMRCWSEPRRPTRPRSNEPELDIPAEIERREDRLAGHRRSHARGWKQRQREADIERGRSDDDERKPARRRRQAQGRAATSASSACPRPRHRKTSPTPTAAS